MNVAVYGGSFDPPHLGHVMVVSHLLLNDPSIDKVIVMVCYQQTGKNLTAFEDRFEMAKHAFEWLPRTEVSNLEQRLGGESLTCRTMRALKSEKPEWNLRFVLGSDLLEKAPLWDDWKELCELAPPLPIGRAGISPVRSDQPTPISPLVSSTIVREALFEQRHRDAERYLPCAVLSYIRSRSLYVSSKPTLHI